MRHCLATVRLACVKHAASVHPEPGSNSPSLNFWFFVCTALLLRCCVKPDGFTLENAAHSPRHSEEWSPVLERTKPALVFSVPLSYQPRFPLSTPQRKPFLNSFAIFGIFATLKTGCWSGASAPHSRADAYFTRPLPPCKGAILYKF